MKLPFGGDHTCIRVDVEQFLHLGILGVDPVGDPVVKVCAVARCITSVSTPTDACSSTDLESMSVKTGNWLFSSFTLMLSCTRQVVAVPHLQGERVAARTQATWPGRCSPGSLCLPRSSTPLKVQKCTSEGGPFACLLSPAVDQLKEDHWVLRNLTGGCVVCRRR